MIHDECNKMLLLLRVYAHNKHFPQNISFFHNFMSNFSKLSNQKTNIHVNFANVWWVAFSIPSGSFSLVKYPVYCFPVIGICSY
jgi:hypothetical protein